MLATAPNSAYDPDAELDQVTRDVMSIPRFKPRLIYDEYLPEEQIVSIPLGEDDSDNEGVKGERYVVHESAKRKRITEDGETVSTSASSDSDSDSDSSSSESDAESHTNDRVHHGNYRTHSLQLIQF